MAEFFIWVITPCFWDTPLKRIQGILKATYGNLGHVQVSPPEFALKLMADVVSFWVCRAHFIEASCRMMILFHQMIRATGS